MTTSRTELRNRFRRLPEPPRAVPYGIRAQLYLGTVGWGAAVALLVLVIPVHLFAFGGRSVESVRLVSPDAEAEGTVTSFRRTSMSSGKKHSKRYYHENHFVFTTDQGRTVRQHSYTLGGHYRPGNPVQVEYRRSAPRLARIRGTDFSLAGGLGLGILGLFLAAFVGFLVALFKGRRLVRLLAHGRITDGVVIGSEPTGTRINGRPELRYRFRYQDLRGDPHTVTCTALQDASIGDEDAEPVLYLPGSPGEGAVLVDALPGQVELGSDHAWRARATTGGLAFVIGLRGLAWAAGLYVIGGVVFRLVTP